MTSGWTGGQYSLVRALTGAGALLVCAAFAATHSAARPLAAIACASATALALAVGWHPRIAAIALAGSWVAAWWPSAMPTCGVMATAALFHAAFPPPVAPYGSIDAADRLDPGGGWRPRPQGPSTAWIMVAYACAVLVFLWPQSHPWHWAFALLSFQALAFDPAWVPGGSKGTLDTLFYDGNCGLCHGAVRFVLAEDPDGTAVRFAPLDSDAFRAAVPADVRATLPDSLVVATADGRVLTRSAGVLHLGQRLGGIWRALATIAGVLPTRLLDAAYDVVARLRHRLFAKPKDACPLLPPHLRARFLA